MLSIKVENLSKVYQLGEIGTGTLSRDLERWYAKVRGKEDPFLRIGEANDRAVKGKSDVVWSLKDINFEIQEGDAVGIIGRNGAGKSTLLKILSKVTSPTTGNIKVKGRIASLLEVGTGFHPELTGRENIFLNGAILGMRKKNIARKFDEIVDFSGIERYIDTPVKRYSSGMYVRLAFAVAAYLESEILIVDEVLAVGDAEFQKKCLGKMSDVSQLEGRTVLFVSHNMASVRRLCKRGIFLNKGQISLNDNIDSAITEYLGIKELDKKISSTSIGGVHVKEIFFRDINNRKIKTFSTYDSISIVMRCIAARDFEKVNFALGFNNVFEARVMTLMASFIGSESDIKRGDLEAVFQINSIKLLPGEYYITTYIASRGQEIERIDNYTKISISFFDKYGIVEEPRLSQGFYLEDFNVSIDQIN